MKTMNTKNTIFLTWRVIDLQSDVTWTAFAILAMFVTSEYSTSFLLLLHPPASSICCYILVSFSISNFSSWFFIQPFSRSFTIPIYFDWSFSMTISSSRPFSMSSFTAIFICSRERKKEKTRPNSIYMYEQLYGKNVKIRVGPLE